jgi:Na+-driven multidrug efflux pump
VTAGEAYFLGWLGADALAGVSLAFPLVMLMQTMSAGGMGGGVSAAVARALGAGRRRDADALGFHALLIAIVMGAGFTGALGLRGPAVYRAMGGTGGALAAALAYSNIVFGGRLPSGSSTRWRASSAGPATCSSRLVSSSAGRSSR